MHRRRLSVALVLAASMSSGAAAAGGDLVVNGGFEASGPLAAWTSLSAGAVIPGWRVSSGTAALVGRYWAANTGTNSFEVGSPGAGSVEQTIRTVAGHTYRLSFALAGNPEGPPRVKTLEVSAGATTRRFTFDSAGRTRSAMGWTPETLDFVAPGNATTIRFARLDGGRSAWYGPVIDDVAVVEAGRGTAPATAAPATAPPATAPPATATPVRTAAPVRTAVPVRTAAPATSAPRAYAPSGADPYSGVWMAAYPGKPLRVYVDHHGREVSGHAVDGNAAIPAGAIAFTGRVDHAPIVVLGKCTDPDARGWHGTVIEWEGQDVFRLHIANCHAGEVLYSRLRGQ